MPSSSIFVFLDEGLPSDAGCQAAESSTSIGRADFTHVDETAIADPAGSVDGEASQAASAGVSMDLASKRMVDDLVGSETTDEDEIPIAAAQGLLNPISELKDVGNETSYGLIGSSTAREHFGDIQDQPQVSPRPLLPSIYNSPFAPQPGEATPGSRPGTANRTTPSHSQQNSQTRTPLQQQINSSISSMADPSNYNPYLHMNGGYHNQPYLNNVFPAATNYTSGRRVSTTYGNETYGATDVSNFHSSSLAWGGSGTVQAVTNVQTPPNGQGAG